MSKTASATKSIVKEARRVERAQRAANDPWFGKQRRAGEMGRTKSKAGRNKTACRGSWS